MNTYFEKCESLLKPDGMMPIQAITIRDQFYKSALKDAVPPTPCMDDAWRRHC